MRFCTQAEGEYIDRMIQIHITAHTHETNSVGDRTR
jgi:hypothetical protein